MRTSSLLCATTFAVTLATVTLSLAQTSTPTSAFARQLIDQQKQFLEAEKSKNANAMDRAVAEDFQGIATNGDFYEKSEIVDSDETWSKDMRSYEFRVVKLNDDSAVVAYNLILPGENPRYRHMADTWARSDGRWKLKFRQVTPNRWSADDLD
jgi:hypothetical protein